MSGDLVQLVTLLLAAATLAVAVCCYLRLKRPPAPPAGFEREAYKLTTDLYVDTVMAFCRALKLERPVVMGCSIGGRIVLNLAQAGKQGLDFSSDLARLARVIR